MERFVIDGPGGPDSEIHVGPGVAGTAGALPRETEGGLTVVFSQPTVRAIADRVARSFGGSSRRVEVVELPDGEAAKDLTVVTGTYRRLNELGMTRSDLVVGVGGGALTDVAGFVAATYLRGVEAWYVPTTLLGAVDAAIGGKTGVNVDGKNLAGAFRHPRHVLVDLEVLGALPRELIRQGAAEAVKAGFVADPTLVGIYEAAGIDAPLEEVVPRAIAVKAAVVSEDFRERGRRAVLNFGHTVGHAVESRTGISHGDAVAIGMAAAARVSTATVGFEDEDRLRAVIAALGLPLTVEGVTRDDVANLLALDKKRGPDSLRMVVLRRIGAASVIDVDDATVGAALGAVGIG